MQPYEVSGNDLQLQEHNDRLGGKSTQAEFITSAFFAVCGRLWDE